MNGQEIKEAIICQIMNQKKRKGDPRVKEMFASGMACSCSLLPLILVARFNFLGRGLGNSMAKNSIFYLMVNI